MNEPNWEKINLEKHNDILIGRCENQALELMKSSNFFDTEVQNSYNQLVKILYKLNLHVEAELMNPQTKEVPHKETSLSSKQKLCPRCKKPIPKTWTHHIECGWK